ncbi:MAG: alpha/beta hydrolase [Oscillospiraceae bacterium]|nr:alpha/beta hydrolase [Oscillospiraceae bacterium]
MTGTVNTARFSMDYLKFGKGTEALVIIPGLGVKSVMLSAKAVEAAYSLFAEEYTVYLFDRRRELPEKYTIADMAQDTFEAMCALGLRSASAFGASQGGMTALALAIAHPEAADKLVLGSTTARVTAERFRVIAEWIALADKGDAEALYLDFGRSVYPEKIFEASRSFLRELAKGVTDKELARFAKLAETMEGFDVTDELGKIACPVLCLSSRDDGVFGEGAESEIAEALGGRDDFEQYVYDGFGHAAYDTAPDYKARISAFLKGNAGVKLVSKV